jgi:hypothetical protein
MPISAALSLTLRSLFVVTAAACPAADFFFTHAPRPYRLHHGVRLQPQLPRRGPALHALGQQLFELLDYCLGQHRRPAYRPGAVEPARTLTPIGLYRPLHTNRGHPERAGDLRLCRRAVHHELTGEHAKRADILRGMHEHRQLSVEVRHPPIPALKGQVLCDGRCAGRKDRKLKLRHTPPHRAPSVTRSEII